MKGNEKGGKNRRRRTTGKWKKKVGMKEIQQQNRSEILKEKGKEEM